ncbi:uncharacterized protein LOC115164062 [Salmo trutta]|uniref:uncharacterized protein LOC115164062 n=1 Tax=Salmo trutta TaxID=8032 RepID=UPI0011324632|nr:uncharacterized protein LOC115164062 [Salmo trutta]
MTGTVDLDIWPENFTVPWGKMSMNLRSAIARGKQPTPGERREMVRITVDAMRVNELNQTRADCRTIAKRMRCAINTSPALKLAVLRSKWPYLFTQKELYNHFKLLTDVSILERILIVQGSVSNKTLSDTMTAAQWMISMEKAVMMSVHSNFVAVLAAFFASFYTFNLQYQEEASHTLEFIQRCFAGINPSTGSKTATAEVISKKSGKVVEKK